MCFDDAVRFPKNHALGTFLDISSFVIEITDEK